MARETRGLSLGRVLHVLEGVEWLIGLPVNLPDFVMESIVVVVVEFFVLLHPVGKVPQLEGALPSVDAILFKDSAGKFLDDVMNAGRLHFHVIIAHLQLDRHRAFVI